MDKKSKLMKDIIKEAKNAPGRHDQLEHGTWAQGQGKTDFDGYRDSKTQNIMKYPIRESGEAYEEWFGDSYSSQDRLKKIADGQQTFSKLTGTNADVKDLVFAGALADTVVALYNAAKNNPDKYLVIDKTKYESDSYRDNYRENKMALDKFASGLFEQAMNKQYTTAKNDSATALKNAQQSVAKLGKITNDVKKLFYDKTDYKGGSRSGEMVGNTVMWTPKIGSHYNTPGAMFMSLYTGLAYDHWNLLGNLNKSAEVKNAPGRHDQLEHGTWAQGHIIGPVVMTNSNAKSNWESAPMKTYSNSQMQHELRDVIDKANDGTFYAKAALGMNDKLSKEDSAQLKSPDVDDIRGLLIHVNGDISSVMALDAFASGVLKEGATGIAENGVFPASQNQIQDYGKVDRLVINSKFPDMDNFTFKDLPKLAEMYKARTDNIITTLKQMGSQDRSGIIRELEARQYKNINDLKTTSTMLAKYSNVIEAGQKWQADNPNLKYDGSEHRFVDKTTGEPVKINKDTQMTTSTTPKTGKNPENGESYKFRDTTVPWSPDAIKKGECPHCGASLKDLHIGTASHGTIDCPSCKTKLTFKSTAVNRGAWRGGRP